MLLPFSWDGRTAGVPFLSMVSSDFESQCMLLFVKVGEVALMVQKLTEQDKDSPRELGTCFSNVDIGQKRVHDQKKANCLA